MFQVLFSLYNKRRDVRSSFSWRPMYADAWRSKTHKVTVTEHLLLWFTGVPWRREVPYIWTHTHHFSHCNHSIILSNQATSQTMSFSTLLVRPGQQSSVMPVVRSSKSAHTEAERVSQTTLVYDVFRALAAKSVRKEMRPVALRSQC
jgi:hypothetical protein